MMVSGASDVPGGRSTTKYSRSPHSVISRNWLIAFVTMGPRQIIASSSFSWNDAMEMLLTPARCGGCKAPST